MPPKCNSCAGNVPTGKSCYKCGLRGPAGDADALLAFYESLRQIAEQDEPEGGK